MTRSKGRGFTMVELLVVMAIIAVLVAILLPAVQYAREASRRSQCRNNLKQLGLALNNYLEQYNLFPPGWIGVTNYEFDANGPSGRGWLTCILPMLEQYAASLQMNANVSITNSANATLRVFNVPNARCPSDTSPDTFSVALQPPNTNPDLPIDLAVGNYVGSFGSTDFHPCATQPVGTACTGNGVFSLNSRVSPADIRDGLTYTMMCGERRSNKTLTPPIYSTWVGAPPGGVEAIARVLGATDYTPNDPANHFESYSSWHSGGINVLLCDGSVQFISDSITTKLYQGLATIHLADDAPVFGVP